MGRIKELYRVSGSDLFGIINELNLILTRIGNRFDKVEGYRGTPVVQAPMEFAEDAELINPILRNPTIITTTTVGEEEVEEETTTGIPEATAGDYLEASDDDEENTFAQQYTLMKEIKLTSLRGGTYRIKFDLKMSSLYAYFAKARIYRERNGVSEMVGEEKINTTTDYQEKSQDIDGWEAGDLVQLYAKIPIPIYSTYVRNFRIYSGNPIISTEV